MERKNEQMIKIKRNTNGDSRVAKKTPTFYEFMESNREHTKDVGNMMKEFSKIIVNKGENHDWTKKDDPFSSMFYRDLCNTIEGKMRFEDGEWSKLHYDAERHHLSRNVPEDVNLFDVLEMIADCVCAGYARSGAVRPLEIDESILIKAMMNTVEIAKSLVSIDEEMEE